MFKKQQLFEKLKPKIYSSQSNEQEYWYRVQQPSINNVSEQEPSSPSKSVRQVQPKEENIDMRRLKRAIFQFEGAENTQDEDQPERKTAVKMNVFRESAREQQREFHQQNHEYLRMFSVIASSAMSMDKFKIKELRDGAQSGQNKGQNKTSKSSQNFATVHLQLQTELSSSLVTYKFPVRDIYNTVPFVRQSIEFQSRQFLDPKFEFFVFEKCSQKIEEVRNNLRNVLQEGLTTEFKGTVTRTIGNLDYFEFLDLTNYRQWNPRSNDIEYPKEIIELAEQGEAFEITSDQEEFYTRGQIFINQIDTNERMVACEQFDLQQTAPSVYFEVTQDYTLYKKYRQIQFKKLKIYNKDININTDIRNIISSQKIYLIELVKQIDLYIQLSTHQTNINIMKEVNKQLKRKCEQFLKVICNYTQSKILKHYNIDNYHEKIMMFIEKSIKYNKEIENVSKELLNEFPILKIWYEIPKFLFGYSRENLHKKYYDLVRAMLAYEDKIKDLDLQKKMSIRRPNVVYPE